MTFYAEIAFDASLKQKEYANAVLLFFSSLTLQYFHP